MNKRFAAIPDSEIAQCHSSEMEAWGIPRREFLKFCTAITAAMGLPFTAVAQVAKAISNPQRPPVIWLHLQECTGCTESLLRATHPKVEDLILDMISLDYSETLMAAAGHQADSALQASVKQNSGKFILVVEGSIPTKNNGLYCQIGGRTAREIVEDIGPKALAAIAIGSCASWGGVQSASPNPTGAVGLNKILTEVPVIALPGCPASPYNLLSTVLYYLTLKKLPELDDQGRPLFAYEHTIHEYCERRPQFEAGNFAEQFSDEGHRAGQCLYFLGCKGHETHANCSTIRYGDTGSWPVGGGHPCFGCAEEGVGFTKPAFEEVEDI